MKSVSVSAMGSIKISYINKREVFRMMAYISDTVFDTHGWINDYVSKYSELGLNNDRGLS
jgi:hypothetical protein